MNNFTRKSPSAITFSDFRSGMGKCFILSCTIKQIAVLACGILFLSGCATYRFQHGKPPYNKGYVAARDDKVLLEYTLGKDKSLPGIRLAKERFNRRKRIVEHYYKKMGVIQNRFTMAIWEPVINFWKMVGGVFRLPFIVISDFRYEHSPKYRERIRKLQDERDLKESIQIKKQKDKLDQYISKDIAKEVPAEVQQTEEKVVQAVAEKVKELEQPAQPQEAAAPVTVPVTPAPVVAPEEVASKPEEKVKEEPVEIPEQKIAQLEEKVIEAKQVETRQAQDNGVKAVIIANPVKGYSPLRVKFNGLKSSSKQGRVVSYSWDFGDGETSTKPKPVNLYWSATYGSRYYTATLTVKDDKGNSAVSTATIEVLTK